MGPEEEGLSAGREGKDGLLVSQNQPQESLCTQPGLGSPTGVTYFLRPLLGKEGADIVALSRPPVPWSVNILMDYIQYTFLFIQTGG